ncbi:MAG: BrnA antitoxin family protein [Acidobacteriota bacterium]
MSKSTTSKASQTDWRRVDAQEDKDIDLSEHPELTPEQFARAVVRKGLKPVAPPKQQVSLRIDADVVAWFKSQVRGASPVSTPCCVST